MKVVTFGASNSSQSLNQKFAIWAASQLENVEVEVLDLNDFEMPLYSADREQQTGIPAEANQFHITLQQADAIIISLAEHNGSYTAAFKNVFDWSSRIEGPTWADKPLLLLATSPGPRGGQNVLKTAAGSFPHQGGRVVGSFSLPSFHQNFDGESGIASSEMKKEFTEQLEKLQGAINEAETEKAAAAS